ncbi:DgyrCDS4518 [Dimorphilus gyrociliatus]|uniref:DgyrCDS4518 n=1 Tax=Dimorphilus gyrociliatus TaxID=2664684 RepID=A0A7I8VIN2_9ANNE|nr:DgyrCDS4518 [Dimorphilus gyrociliatus]
MIDSTMKGRIVVFSIIGCPHCMNAKNLLQEKGLEYADVSLDEYPQMREWLRDNTNSKTVPQIFFNALHVGGNAELKEKIKDKAEWEALLEEIEKNAPGSDAPELPHPSTAVASTSIGDFTCEPDEYAKLVEEMRNCGIVKNHSKIFSTVKNAFTGKDFVEWVKKAKKLDETTAIEMGQALIDQHFGKEVKKDGQTFKADNTLYRLIEDDDSTALNAGETSPCTQGSALQLAESMRKLILKLYSVFLSSDGKKVNYKGISTASEFKMYLKLTKELIRVDIEHATREEKLAFFINIYNALVIHANIVLGPPTNLWQRYKFFNTVRYIIGGNEYSLQDIENGVLRANRKGVGQFRLPFGKDDPRRKIALKENEPLIHFALNCGAKSCPPIKTFSANGIDEQLKMAAEAFLDNDDGCTLNRNSIKLSKIFSWYKEDFGKNNADLANWIFKTMGAGDKKDKLEEILSGKNYSLSFLDYDWGVNSK